MLKEIIIENFQPWKYLHLVLSEGYTALIGKSDKGKSAVVRAINWCINNRPTGFAFRRWKAQDEDVTRVTLIFNNGTVIREKNADIDQYRLQLPGKKEKVFKTLNRQVPDEIKNFFNLDFYNLKGQFDTFFLLQDSPGEVGRKFNEIVDLEIIDATLKSINSIVSEAKSEKEKLEKDKENLQHELDRMSYLDTLKIEIDKFYDDLEKAGEIEDTITAIEDILISIKELEEEIEDYSLVLQFDSEVNHLISDIVKFQNEEEKISAVESLWNEIDDLAFEINDLMSLGTHYDDLVKLVAEIEEYEKEAEKLDEIESYVRSLKSLDRQIEEKSKLISFDSLVNSLISEIAEFEIKSQELTALELLINRIQKYEKEISGDEKKLKQLCEEYDNMIGEGTVVCDKCGTLLSPEELRKRI